MLLATSPIPFLLSSAKMTNNNNNNHNHNHNNNNSNNNTNTNTNTNTNRQQQQPPPPPSHPALEQLPGVQYCINSSPPMLDAILLGFQHYVLALGSTVLIPSLVVPQMGGSDKDKAEVIQTLLFVSGVNTLLHSLFGTRLPSVIGGSYAFLIPVTSIIQSKRYATMHPPGQRFVLTMREIQGALIMSSCFQMIFGFTCLWRNITRLLTPLSTAPLVTFTGLGLYYLGFPQIAKCYEVGLPALVLIFVFSQIIPKYMKRPMCDRYALLISVAIVWMYAEILTMSGAFKKSKQASCRTDGSGLIRSTPWLYIPFPFQWGPPTFTAGETFTAMIASFVALIEVLNIYTCLSHITYIHLFFKFFVAFLLAVDWLVHRSSQIRQCNAGATFSDQPRRRLAGDWNSAQCPLWQHHLLYSNSRKRRPLSPHQNREQKSHSNFIHLHDLLLHFRKIWRHLRINTPTDHSSVLLHLLGLSSAGLGYLQFCNLNSFRTKLIVGISFFVGMSLPQYFREHQLVSRGGPVHTHARWFNDMISVVLMSHATVGGVVALVLDCSLDRGSEQARKDNGSCWWDKFIVYGKDIRNDEFYKLPAHLNKCFPSS
ncbi:putative nucleobase-ascorbate transporter 10 isoform X2 [Salvia miltiorrhiza]|uniref:putative nucleobase-ascorbate transporter 10 isoform X2 n=1 Tax=Salvia miltiorrhiza TaxID=226208 RepID=UPI0025ABDCAA|nr:putative nucleobase-ascorbate transporter 10 isoform X2 [Salvia miltiorrhiza]